MRIYLSRGPRPDVAREIGERIRRYRTDAKLTQADVSDGWCTKAAISAIETGRALPSLDTLWRIADRLGVPVVVLLADEARLESLPPAARIRGVEIDRGRVVVELTDGRIVGAPLSAFEGLFDASIRQLEAWRLLAGRRGVEWPELGVTVNLDDLLGPLAADTRAPKSSGAGRPGRRLRRAAVP